MKSKNNTQKTCALCGKSFPQRALIPGGIIRKEIAAEIMKILPDWSSDKFICRDDFSKIREAYLQSLLESERGELSDLEKEVLHALKENEIISLYPEPDQK